MKSKSLIVLCICFLLSLDSLSAETWSPLHRLTWNSGDSKIPVIAADSSNNIFIVYQDDTPGTYHIFLKRSLDNGLTWTGKRLTWGTWQKLSPEIGVASNDHIHLVYMGNNNYLYTKKSTDAGNTWGTVHNVTWSNGYYPDITFGTGNKIYIVFRSSNSGNFEIYFKKSTDSGNTWIGQKRLTWNTGQSVTPKIVVDSVGHIHVVWCDDTPGHWQIFYKKSTDDGVTWSNTSRLTWTTGLRLRPNIAKDSYDNLYIIYDSVVDIWLKKSTNSGTSWTTKRITWTSNSICPNLCIDKNDTIHITWNEYYSVHDICYKQSTNGGTTWTGYKRVTYGTDTGTESPGIASDGNNNIHLTWKGMHSGNKEIFYKNRK